MWGVIFNPKIHVADFGNFNQGFLIRKLIQNKFQGSGYVLSTFLLRKNQNKTHFGEGTSESLYYLAIMPPRIYATISIIKNLQYYEGRGQRPFGIFPKIHPIW